MLYLVICLRKQTDWFCTFCFLCDYIPRISVLLCSVVLRLKLIFYESIVILFSLSYTSLFILLSLYLFSFSMLSCCLEPSGCTAKPNSLSYNSSRALSHNSGCTVSSFFSPWICGKDCDISEVSWSDSLRFLPFSSFFPFYAFLNYN
jgi:hypothetical protein